MVESRGAESRGAEHPQLTYPATCPEYGAIRLRPFRARDLAMVQDLSTDRYVCQVSSVVADSDEAEAAAWLERQGQRLVRGIGYSFCIARRRDDQCTVDQDSDDQNSDDQNSDDQALGQAGLWLNNRDQGRATAGYLVAPTARGAGVAGEALRALTEFAWTLPDLHLPDLHRVELHIEPWNTASLRSAAAAGYQREGLLRSHQVIGGTRVDMELWAAIRPQSLG